MYAAQSRHDLALAEFEKLRPSPPLNTWGLAWEGHTRAAMGQRQKAEEALAGLHQLSQHTYVRAYLFAVLNLALGRLDDTFAWLQKSFEERDVWLGWIKCDKIFDHVQSDPRFAQLWHNLGLD